MVYSDDEICIICNKLIDENSIEEIGGECCNFCYKTICAECYDKEPPVNYYGWVCPTCENS